jgi:Carboxypeptidase regulatory-like domain
MSAAFTVALGFLFCVFPLCAQQPTGHLTIRVTDVIGAVIPGAHVEIDRAPGAPDTLQITDWKGELTCDIPAGPHTISVHSSGFESWAGQIEITNAAAQLLTATMQITATMQSGPSWGPGPVADFTDYQSFLAKIPEPALLSTAPLATFPLSSRPVGKHEKRAKL